LLYGVVVFRFEMCGMLASLCVSDINEMILFLDSARPQDRRVEKDLILEHRGGDRIAAPAAKWKKHS